MFLRVEKSNPTEVSTRLSPMRAKTLLYSLVMNSRYRIDKLLPTKGCVNSFDAEKLSHCLNVALKQGVKIRILLPIGELEILNDKLSDLNIELKKIKQTQAKKMILIIDNLHSLVIEMDEVKGNYVGSKIRNCIYSTSPMSLMTFSVLFEKMWT
jgi:hypothetical protein